MNVVWEASLTQEDKKILQLTVVQTGYEVSRYTEGIIKGKREGLT